MMLETSFKKCQSDLNFLVPFSKLKGPQEPTSYQLSTKMYWHNS